MRATFIHLEHDGKLYLVDNDGNGPMSPKLGRIMCSDKLGWNMRLPTKEEVEASGISWIEKRRNTIKFESETFDVIYATPQISWPSDWAWKDDVISDSGVHPLARESVYRTMHRLVAKVIILNGENKILMVKVKRGFFTGMWTLPGGYLDYGEHPRKGAAREVFEELGIEIKLEDPLNETGYGGEVLENVFQDHVVTQKIFTHEGINFVSFTYITKGIDDNLKFSLKEDEIEEIGWFAKDIAINEAASWFDLHAIKQLT